MTLICNLSFFIKVSKEFIQLLWYTGPFVMMDVDEAIVKIEEVNEDRK